MMGVAMKWVILFVMVFIFAAALSGTARAQTPGMVADFILVEKTAHLLILYKDGHPLKAYRIALGYGGLGPKREEGDGRTPEGLYKIDGRNKNSLYHFSLHISYPSEKDVEKAKSAGVEPGGQIMIHGERHEQGVSELMDRFRDWTAGCIAVTDHDIDEIAAAVPDGTPIAIRR